MAPFSPQRNRFSREGFQPLPNQHQPGMATSNDATIDIPLERVPSNGVGLRSKQTAHGVPGQHSPYNEKQHLFRGHRHRQTPEQGGRPRPLGYDGEEDRITTMGKVYRKVLNFSIVTRYFVYVSPLAALIAVPIVVGATAAQNAAIGGVRIVWFFTWVEIVWLSLWVSKIVAHFLPFVFQVLVGVVNSGIRKYALVLRSLEIPLSLVGWAVTSLATFMPLMTKNPTQTSLPTTKEDPSPTAPTDWEYIVQKILAAAVVSSLVFLAEKFIVQMISINYHRTQFNARIQESKRNIRLLALLHQTSMKLFPAYCNDFADEDYTIADQLNISLGIGGKHGVQGHSGSHTPMRLIQDIGRYGDKLTSAFGDIAHEVTGKELFNPNSSHSVVIEALEKRRSSEALARRIWMSFVVEGQESLSLDDLVEVLGAGRQNEAEECFAALDSDGNGDISLDEMILAVAEFGRERKSIASSMHDVDQAINVLDRLLVAVVLVAVVFVFVAFLNQSFTTTLATTGTALLSLSFVFAGTCQEILGSCIFLFVKHPFDIGDRVDISTDQYVVEHISLLFTVFRRVTGTGVGRLVQVRFSSPLTHRATQQLTLCQIPNIALNNLYIENVSRSKTMTEQLTISVAFDTSFNDIQILKNELLKFVSDKENSRDFQTQFEVEVLGTTDMSKLDLRVEIRHKSNWANETIRAARRSKFMCALVAALRAVPIYAPGGGGEAQGSAANPSYSVSISDAQAKDNAGAAAEAKQAKRLVPKKTDTADASAEPGTGAGLTQRENRIIDNLTSRDPAVDAARDEAWTSTRDDSSTLGRSSIDQQDIEDVRGLLRRESTKGKRRIGADHRPPIPTIHEPQTAMDQSGYGEPYHDPSPAAPHRPALGSYHPSSYQTAQTMSKGVQGRSGETGQVGTSGGHRYSERSDLSPTAGPSEDHSEGHSDSFNNTRPYSGV